MSNPLRVQCLCKAVTVETSELKPHVGACHCSMCRKWGGGPFLAVESQGQVTVTPTDAVSVFSSSEWAERGFCKACGTHLFYRLKANNHYILPAGLFAEEGELTFDHQIFIDEKPTYYDFANETKTMTGKEVFEQFANLPE
ncbi:GFA family protein [Pseudoalteromonas xiamenensis]|uniref:GFA family protein n=1 Tax=Pseudoalteromonas xiamenensis TaxID=882626 RepID=UPI0027E4520D|nr:GFA family protein [Pseudoalteromonas xiamenensis]WMN60590.1 GFA family protein [Pseudoalteromonas xiamenensis]